MGAVGKQPKGSFLAVWDNSTCKSSQRHYLLHRPDEIMDGIDFWLQHRTSSQLDVVGSEENGH